MTTTNKDEITGEQIENLTIEVVNLNQELRVLRDVMDEIRDDLEFLVRNLRIADVPRPFRISSLPIDPTAEDFNQRVNEVRDEDRQRLRDENPVQSQRGDAPERDDPQDRDRTQRALWRDDDASSPTAP